MHNLTENELLSNNISLNISESFLYLPVNKELILAQYFLYKAEFH